MMKVIIKGIILFLVIIMILEKMILNIDIIIIINMGLRMKKKIGVKKAYLMKLLKKSNKKKTIYKKLSIGS